MGPDPTATIAARRSRNVRVARKPTNARRRPTVVVIECVDNTCTVIGGDPAVPCQSLEEAMDVVEEMAPSVDWRETAPGVWVARFGRTH